MGFNDSGREVKSPLRHGLSSAQPTPTPQKPKKGYRQEPIAVVGMACRLPGNSNSPQALWDFLERGGIADNRPPETRFRFDTHYDGSTKPHTMRSPGGMFLENVDPKKFDAAFFGIATADAIAMDPQQRQLLEVVYECLENSGIPLSKLDGEAIGCFIGSYAVDYADMQSRDPDDRAPSVTIGVGRAILSNRISHFLNIHGPSMTIDTACSGSLVGLDVACRYLSSGEIDGALVGGANLYMSPEHVMDSGPMKGAASLSGKCHTFDKKADGYIKAEAVNCVMLKRLSDAERDGDPIRAVIRGTATNSDGRTPGIASPSSVAQAIATRSAYANAGISDFASTAYIEMHGTGTQAGDPEEVKGVASVFSSSRPRSSPLIIGSIKSNIGHSEPAAGVSGLMKAVLAVEKGFIPGNPTFIDPNPSIDFEGSRVRPTRWTVPWPAQVGPRRASVNSFGYGGSNAHVVLDQVPEDKQKFISSFISTNAAHDDLFADDEVDTGFSRPYILPISANDEKSIKGHAASLRKHLLDPRVSVQIDSLAYTLSERRTRHFHRGYLVTKSLSLDLDSAVYGKQNAETPRIGFVFTGQGGQWPRMGRSLLQNFPVARETINRLDKVLKGLLCPPTWSLAEELTAARSPQTLREPEFSQPLVTALQIALVNLLRTWGIRSQAVVGHSSGEIAAAYAAGLLSEDNAMKAAYYRGYAAKIEGAATSLKMGMGMMAVGLDGESVRPYIERAALLNQGRGAKKTVVTVACYNSPNSVTLAGPVSCLEDVRDQIAADKHFVRMLQVDMAYHSPFMAQVGERYGKCLEAELFATAPASNETREGTKMFSSVEGDYTQRPVDIAYWKSNMVQPVLFGQALEQMLTRKDPPDFLIEIGPSGALAGPVGQVKKLVPGGGSNIQYCSAMARGQEAETAIFGVAGKLFIAGHDVDLAAVNAIPVQPPPKVLVDLPNYSWNHDKDFWYESEASQDWRNRLFPHHDLLGSKVLGTAWQAPSWKKSLRVEDLTWLKDHRLGPEVVFPGAGYMCMAVEAMFQTDAALATEGEQRVEQQQVRLRNVKFDRALVLEEGKETRIMLTMAPLATQKAKDGWYFWVVRSLVQGTGTWLDHCSGQVRLEKDVQIVGTPSDIASLELPAPGATWYKSMSDVGYNFGKAFRKLQQVEAVSGSRQCRSQIDLLPPPSQYTQSKYLLHPAALDGCMQSCAPGLWGGVRSSVNAVLVPAVIDDIVIRKGALDAQNGVSVSRSVFSGPGRKEETKNYASNAKVYNSTSGNLLFKLTGLRYHKLDFQDTPYADHHYSRLVWAPDLSLSPQASNNVKSYEGNWEQLQHVLDLVAHKRPNAKVLEAVLVPNESSSLWLDGLSPESKPRKAYGSYAFLTADPTALVSCQTKHDGLPRTAFNLLDGNKSLGQSQSTEAETSSRQVDLIILRVLHNKVDNHLDGLLESAREMLSDDGHVLLVEQMMVKDSPEQNGHATNGVSSTIDDSIRHGGFEKVQSLDLNKSDWVYSGHLLTIRSTSSFEKGPATPLDIVHFAAPGKICHNITRELSAREYWDVRELTATESLDQIRDNSTVVVISELEAPQLPTLSPEQWTALQSLFQRRNNRILWVSRASQWKVQNPDGAMIHGLCRSIRTEDPSMRITTLDIEDPAKGESTAAALSIDKLLRVIQQQQQPNTTGLDTEYVEREGIFYVSRILGDDAVNALEAAKTTGPSPVEMRLHEAPTTVRMIAERVGSIDSLHYVEVDSKQLALPENTVEVELFASALNFKDVAVTMGIVPENQHLLGLEGAGRIRRVGANLNTPFNISDRVLVFEKGTFANRIVATTERTVRIPDWLSFEEAATLPSVYLTALYSLFNLGSLKKGDRVLIHSATGGLGLASIQICRMVGAEVYVTVGQDVKRDFLVENFGISRDRIFNSRNPGFEAAIMEHTSGYGVDIILNSLTGDLLDASWRCIAEGGTMVELGKKDHIDRNSLSMEPFARNASYRCFDMSHKHVSDLVIADLFRRMMDLINTGVVKPISPIKLFAYNDIPSALRFMRSANHIGKIIISNKDHAEADPAVPVRPALRSLELRGDVSYLIVGGLKGLCGSLAVDMARHGARNLVIMSRSGCDDPRSRGILRDLGNYGCSVDVARGDVSKVQDVRLAFNNASKPVAGVIQGSMVLRDKPFETMTLDEYHMATSCKVAGTWNLHNTAIELGLDLDFFTMLSSISGLIGQPAQANYAAGNVFLDNFAYYRRGLGLKANSIDLGAIDDVGYMAEHSELIAALDTSAWTPINEGLFQKIVQFSIMQQEDDRPVNLDSVPQLITSIAVPQAPSSRLLTDARFSSLLFGASAGGGGSSTSDGSNKEIQALQLMIKSGADMATALPLAVEVANKQFMVTLRIEEALESGKPLSAYGLDSLAAVEFRNWSRAQLGAELTTLEITGAPTLTSLAEKIVTRLQAAEAATAAKGK
ncbi:putative polyketide synthase [Poronia punctata]|nr:putative polyketide synthase [Poronia punctata]